MTSSFPSSPSSQGCLLVPPYGQHTASISLVASNQNLH